MAEERTPVIIDFEDQGQRVLSYIDVIDESVYGAGNLYLRGRAYTLDEAKALIEKGLAVGSPVEMPATNPLAVGRFNQLNRNRFYPDDNDNFPRKAQFMLHIHLRVKFYDSFADIDLGIPWASLYINDGTMLNPDYPMGEHALGDTFSIADLKLLRCCWISTKDACSFLQSLGVTNPLPDKDKSIYLVTEDAERAVIVTDEDTPLTIG